MSALEIDRTDAAIVRELQADGRLPFETLAGRVGLSRAAARLRVRRLLDTKAIRVVGVLHPAVRGIGALAHLSIGVRRDAGPVAAAVADLPEATLVHLTAGRFPLIAQVRGYDLPRLTAVVDRVRELPGVAEVDTAVYTNVVKDPYLASSGPPDITPDDIDLRLLRLLEGDGRLSFADLAGRVGLSAGAVRTRVMRLMRGRAVHVTALLDPGAVGLDRHGGFALRLGEGGDAAAKEIASWESTQFLTGCLGRADLVGTLAAASIPGLHAAYERLRILPGVTVTETWIHLAQVKERYDLWA
ncbi:Lrp/AsnC family transcriptional regulator [Nocardiopsis sediminis]|uniref:Lrp/AsnC family transcriptional regulator n=1 Tax=Nocardiopsis sediminis TaxID=1778267 RepID=A0ABV8FL07_9ACTN